MAISSSPHIYSTYLKPFSDEIDSMCSKGELAVIGDRKEVNDFLVATVNKAFAHVWQILESDRFRVYVFNRYPDRQGGYWTRNSVTCNKPSDPKDRDLCEREFRITHEKISIWQQEVAGAEFQPLWKAINIILNLFDMNIKLRYQAPNMPDQRTGFVLNWHCDSTIPKLKNIAEFNRLKWPDLPLIPSGFSKFRNVRISLTESLQSMGRISLSTK